MKRLVIMVLCLLFIGCLGCQSIKELSEESLFKPQINPYSGNVGDETQSVTLYFPVTGEAYLSNYTTTVEVHTESGDTLTEALMRALIKGPEQGLSLDPVFIEDLKRISMNLNGSVLTVVLSKEMLTMGEGSSAESALIKQLTLYSIVNTMTGNEDITQVQILIDMDDSGYGETPTRQQVGLTDDKDEELGPLGFSNTWLLTPAAATQIVLDAGIDKDAARMIRLLGSSVLTPDEQTLEDHLEAANVLIADYYITDTVLSADNLQATVYVDITYELMDQSVKQAFNQAVSLERERGTWKVDYLSVEPMLFP